MEREDGTTASLFYDQVGSLRAVADAGGLPGHQFQKKGRPLPDAPRSDFAKPYSSLPWMSVYSAPFLASRSS